MSSEVHAKWKNSATPASSECPATASLRKYSTALTSWFVSRSIAWVPATRKAVLCESESTVRGKVGTVLP